MPDSSANTREIGEIGNCYGGLEVKQEDGCFFWGIDNPASDYGYFWEEIPEDLFQALHQFQDRKEQNSHILEVLPGGSRRSRLRQAIRLLPPHLQFPLRLYQLLEEFNAELSYTNNDDGIHLSIGGNRILDDAGFLDRDELRQLLIKAGVLAEQHARRCGELVDQEQADG